MKHIIHVLHRCAEIRVIQPTQKTARLISGEAKKESGA